MSRRNRPHRGELKLNVPLPLMEEYSSAVAADGFETASRVLRKARRLWPEVAPEVGWFCTGQARGCTCGLPQYGGSEPGALLPPPDRRGDLADYSSAEVWQP